MEIPEFEDTVAEFAVFQKKEIKRRERAEDRNRGRRRATLKGDGEMWRGLGKGEGDGHDVRSGG